MELQYEIAYHLRCRFPLRSGRMITLKSLDQDMTYAGMLVGTPSAAINDWHISSALREAQRHCVMGAKPHLVQPPRRDFLREPGDMQSIAEWSPNRAPEWLPMVRCIGLFEDVAPISCLVVVWFQDEFALPVLEPALSQLRELNWETLATEYEPG